MRDASLSNVNELQPDLSFPRLELCGLLARSYMERLPVASTESQAAIEFTTQFATSSS